jgi:hypothetical protein
MHRICYGYVCVFFKKRVAEPVPLSKPAMSTNISMAGWGLTMIQDNPIIP